MLPLGDMAAYTRWVGEHDTLTDADRTAIQSMVARLPVQPVFSLVLTGHGGGTPLLESLRRQLYPFWEVWSPAGPGVLADAGDFRVRTLPAHDPGGSPGEALNAALAAAEGDFVIPLPVDAVLAEHALSELAFVVAEHPDADLLYTDEDRLDAAGQRCLPRFKTAWDPDLMLGRDAVGHLAAYCAALLRRVGPVRPDLPTLDLALYDLALRSGSCAGPARIRHVPAVLCHRRGASDPALTWDAERGREIVRRHLEATGECGATVEPAPAAPGWNRVVRPVRQPGPLVSVIVPTRDRADLMARCAEAVLSRTDYAPLELVVVDNGSEDPAALALLRQLAGDARVRIVGQPGPFNFSALINHGVREARGEVVVLLNNDTDVIGAGWLREMVAHALRPGVGAVGAKLRYPDGRVQHAGVVLSSDGGSMHQLQRAEGWELGPGGELALVRTVKAVTGACLAMRRAVFLEVGGLEESHLKVTFNDIDLCLRVGERGYRIVWTPFAELFHLESMSRGRDDERPEGRRRSLAELGHFQRIWGPLLAADPFHNPNLDFRWDRSVYAAPPRRERPWRRVLGTASWTQPPGRM